MEANKCFEPGCMREVEYACKCTSPLAYSCELHFGKHLKLPNKAHDFDTLFVEPCEETKKAVLEFLTKEKSKNSKLKSKITNSFSQQLLNSENDLEDLIKNLDSSSVEINNCFEKICHAIKLSKSEQDPVLKLLCLQPDEAVEKIKTITPHSSDWIDSAKEFFGFSRKIEKMIECFIKDKFEAYLDRRLFKIENALKEHNKIIGLVSNELPSTMNSISEIINKNKTSIKEIEELKEEIKVKTESMPDLLNSQIASIAEDINYKLKNLETQSRNRILDFEEIRYKTIKILNKPNDPELEMEFRQTCSIYESSPSIYDQQAINAYYDYLNIYHQKSSIYCIDSDENSKITNLYIYNTENETQESKVLDTPEKLSDYTCITQLPNNKLFCFGNYPPSGITLIIDSNFNTQVLPSGTPCAGSSAFYFDNSVYCFGGYKYNQRLTLSHKFDLSNNRWIELAQMPQADGNCNIVIFKGSILISGYYNRNLLSYCIDANSFTIIPFQFSESRRKILINAERLYLIEGKNGSIYENEIGSVTAWRQISNSIISDASAQVYCSYNKGAIYIAKNTIYKFNLSEKRLYQLK